MMKKLCGLLFSLALLCMQPASASSSEQSPDASKVHLGSVHAAVFDVENGSALYEKNSDAVVSIASITKLMTAMVVLDSGQSLHDMIEIKPIVRELGKNTYSRMRIGSELSRRDLLLIALMSSENLAAINLAKAHPGGFDAFVKAMNEKAKSLGMNSSHFVEPSGLKSGNVSTAADLVKMVVAANDYPLITEFSTTAQHDVRFKNPRYTLSYANTNALVRGGKWDINLSKTGYTTEAGRCLVMMTDIDGRSVAMVLLDSLGKRTPLGDAGRIKKWLTVGKSGKVAGVARRYEREKVAKYTQASISN
jgi:D-alanyl-D-alanine endopeptidase (penicillin-binding protein 7)